MTLFHFHPEREELLIEFSDGAKAKVSLIGNKIIITSQNGSTLLEVYEPRPSGDLRLARISAHVLPPNNS